MQWVSKQTDDYEIFMHITLKSNIKSIKQHGIRRSNTGWQLDGDGVYCIHSDDYNAYDSIIQFMEMNNLNKKDLAAIEFEYNGNYSEVECTGLENGWCSIPELIDSESILNINEI